jgi:hypothetical protein
VLLVIIDKFDPNPVLVNINKIKSYWFVEDNTLKPIIVNPSDLFIKEPIEEKIDDLLTKKSIEKELGNLLFVICPQNSTHFTIDLGVYLVGVCTLKCTLFSKCHVFLHDYYNIKNHHDH